MSLLVSRLIQFHSHVRRWDGPAAIRRSVANLKAIPTHYPMLKLCISRCVGMHSSFSVRFASKQTRPIRHESSKALQRLQAMQELVVAFIAQGLVQSFSSHLSVQYVSRIVATALLLSLAFSPQQNCTSSLLEQAKGTADSLVAMASKETPIVTLVGA